MGRGTRWLTAAAMVCALMAVPATASAQSGPLDLITHRVTVPITVGPAPGTASTFTLFLQSELLRPFNDQVVSGTFGSQPFAGVLFLHTYERATDTGHYRLFARVGPTAQALLADVALGVDRFGNVVIVGLAGTIGGRPFALSRSVTLPL